MLLSASLAKTVAGKRRPRCSRGMGGLNSYKSITNIV